MALSTPSRAAAPAPGGLVWKRVFRNSLFMG